MMSNKTENLESTIQSINKSIALYGTELDRYIRLKQEYGLIKQYIQKEDSLLKNTEEMEFLLDVNTMVVIAQLDLAVIFKNLIQAESRYEEIYFVKQAYLSVYESLKTFSFFQKKLKEVFDLDGTRNSQFLAVLQDLRGFKKKHGYDTHLALIRNKVAGHIDNDFVIYHELISALEKDKALYIILDLLPILNQVQGLTTILVQEEKQRLELNLIALQEKIATTLDDIERHVKNLTSK